MGTEFRAFGTLVGPDGVEVCRAEVSVEYTAPTEGTLGEWHGGFSATGMLMHLIQSPTLRLRLDDGREGDVIVTNANYESQSDSTHILFQGSGGLDAPSD